MKRIIALVIIIALLVMLSSGCAGGADPDNLDFDRAFSFTAEIIYNDSVSAADFARTAPDVWTGTLTAPYALQGMQVAFTPAEMTVSYSGFDVDFSEDTPPEINVSAFLMIKTLENAFALQGVNVSGGRDSIELAGTFDGDSYVLRLDRDGLPVSLEVPRRQLRVTFSEVRTAKLLSPSDLE